MTDEPSRGRRPVSRRASDPTEMVATVARAVPLDPDTVADARRTCAAHARDRVELADLLDMLGLLPGQDS